MNDQLRLNAMACFGDSVARVAHVGDIDGESVERVDPVYRLLDSQVYGGSASDAVVDDKPERGR